MSGWIKSSYCGRNARFEVWPGNRTVWVADTWPGDTPDREVLVVGLDDWAALLADPPTRSLR